MKEINLSPAADYPISAYIDLGKKEIIKAAKKIMSNNFYDNNKETLEKNKLTFKIQNSYIDDNSVLLLTVCVFDEENKLVTYSFKWN